MGQFGVHMGMFFIGLFPLENFPLLQSCFSSHSPVQLAPPYAGGGFVQYLLRTISPPGPQSTEQGLHRCHSPKSPATKDEINFKSHVLSSYWCLAQYIRDLTSILIIYQVSVYVLTVLLANAKFRKSLIFSV